MWVRTDFERGLEKREERCSWYYVSWWGCKMRIWQPVHYRLSWLMLINPIAHRTTPDAVLHRLCFRGTVGFARWSYYISPCVYTHTQVEFLAVCCNAFLSAKNTLEILDRSFLTPCDWSFEILSSTIFNLLDGSVLTCSAWRYPFIYIYI